MCVVLSTLAHTRTHTLVGGVGRRGVEQESHVVVGNVLRMLPLQLTQRRVVGHKQGERLHLRERERESKSEKERESQHLLKQKQRCLGPNPFFFFYLVD